MKTKRYLLFYYLGLIIIGVLFFLKNHGVYYTEYGYFYLMIINALIVLINTIALIKKKKFEISNELLPLSFVVFSIIIVIGVYLFNDRVILPYIHFGYYLGLLVYGYTFVNIYTILNIKFKG